MTKSIWKNSVLQIAENCGFLNFVQHNFRGTGQFVYILAYHRVDEFDHRPWLDPSLISATPQQFEEQMELVASRYHPISAEDLLAAVRGELCLPKDAVLVTVDDGYRDFAEVIYPACRRYHIKPVLFVPTAYVGAGTLWWDKVYQIIYMSGRSHIYTPLGRLALSTEKERRLAQANLIMALKRMPYDQVMEWIESTYAASVQLAVGQIENMLNWNELARVAQGGTTVACHTHTHAIMTQISIDEARRQARMSQELIQQKLGGALPIFAFPDGKKGTFSPAVCEMLFSEGFEILFLLTRGRALIQPGSQKIILPRVSVWQSQTLPQFHMRLTPLIGRA